MTAVYGVAGQEGRTLTRALLTYACTHLWGAVPSQPLTYSPRGKPLFAQPGRWLSLSHSGGLAVCALSDCGPVGADVELVRPHRPSLPRYALAPEELAQFDGTWSSFTRLWTLKESWCKREDSPLYPPRRAVMPPHCPHEAYHGGDWWAAVCCHGPVPDAIVWVPPSRLPPPHPHLERQG